MEREMDFDIKPALHLPEDLKDYILTDRRLNLHHKFVLFTLYYLDSKGKLDEYGSYVPHFLNLAEEDFKKSIDELARHKYLRLEKESLSLSIRPLRYNSSLTA